MNETSNIKLYQAPLEGLTGFPWRKAQNEIFGCTDKYFTPFIVANMTHKFKTKELRDITQGEENLVPQILTDKPEHFIWAVRELQALGYSEINLNLGCPSPTVVTRGKGSALLKDIFLLDCFLEDIFSSLSDIKVSIKTRVGFDDKSMWPEILSIFSKYPISELIVHPRLRSEFYDGTSDIGIFKESLNKTGLKLVYNGDVTSINHEAFSFNIPVMAGRGLVSNPALFRQIKGGKAADKSELKDFHDILLSSYKSYMQSDGPVIHHMKSTWVYFESLFNYDAKVMKKLKKTRNLNEYLVYANEILSSPKLLL